MKTFNEKDLITWSNREKAVIGNEYYFADSLIGMKSCINNNCSIYTLDYIAEENICAPFNCKDSEGNLSYACILPVDAVKENKSFRACKNVQELYELVSNLKSKMSEKECIDELIGTVIHFKQKGFDTTLYLCITGIAVYNNGDIAVHIDSCNFELDDLFKNYKIEINGEWLPFGVEV